MTVDPWGGFNRGYGQLMNVLAMKRQEERGNATNALASRKMKMEESKMSMEESKMSREAEAEKIQDTITLTQDMTGDGSPEDMAKFPQRRALYVQKWGESPNIPQNYDPQFIQSLKGLNRQEWKPTSKSEALELKGGVKKWEPQTKEEAIEFEQAKKQPKINDLKVDKYGYALGDVRIYKGKKARYIGKDRWQIME